MSIGTKSTRHANRAGRESLLSSLLFAAALLLSYPTTTSAVDLGLIEPASLKGGSSVWVILDARPKDAWEAGHLPGAIQFFWDSYTRTDAKGVQYASFPPHELAVALAGLGIDEMLRRGVVLIEWADRAGDAIPRPRWQIEIEHVDARRRRFSVRRVE